MTENRRIGAIDPRDKNLKKQKKGKRPEHCKEADRFPFFFSLTNIIYWRNRQFIIKYICRECGQNFSATTGTVLEKTRYTWNAWVLLVFCLINGYSLKQTQQMMADDLKCIKIDEKTAIRMRLKIMNDIKHMDSPTLFGIVQVDDTFFRENQKGAVELVNPIHEDMDIPREPRYGAISSEFGVRGNEFATATCAIDGSGHCVCRVLGTGSIKAGVMKGFFEEHMDDIVYICTDAEQTYRKVCADMDLPHYVKPSTYLKTLEKEGYEQPSKADDFLAEQQREHDSVVLERLYNKGQIDYIASAPDMTYQTFVKTKQAHRLNLGRVNQLHSELKMMLEKKTTGVNTKYLPYYLALFEFLHNRKIDRGHPIVSMYDAEEILKDVVRLHVNITEDEWAKIRATPFSTITEQASGIYMHELGKQTEKARELAGDRSFRFGAEDGVETFSIAKQLKAMHIATLKELAKQLKIKGRAKMAKRDLVEALRVHPDIKDAVIVMIAEKNKGGDQAEGIYTKKRGRKHNTHKNRKTRSKMFPERIFSHVDDVDTDNIVFIDTETTGTKFGSDEVLTLAAVSIDGDVIYDEMFRPRNHKTWKEAMEKNHIAPEMTIGKPSIASEKGNIEKMLVSDGVIVGWNVQFDMRMLHAAGVNMPLVNGKYVDLMKEFKAAYSKTLKTAPKRQYTLEEAVAIVGATNKNPHNAMADSAVLIDIWNWTRDILTDADGQKAA